MCSLESLQAEKWQNSNGEERNGYGYCGRPRAFGRSAEKSQSCTANLSPVFGSGRVGSMAICNRSARSFANISMCSRVVTTAAVAAAAAATTTRHVFFHHCCRRHHGSHFTLVERDKKSHCRRRSTDVGSSLRIARLSDALRALQCTERPWRYPGPPKKSTS